MGRFGTCWAVFALPGLVCAPLAADVPDPTDDRAALVAYEAVIARDGSALRELARHRALVERRPDVRARFDALAGELAHHVTTSPAQRITDFRDARHRVDVAPYPALDYTDAVTFSLWLALHGEVTVEQTKVVSHAGVDGGKLTLVLDPGGRVSVLARLDDGRLIAPAWRVALPLERFVHLALSFDRAAGFRLWVDGVMQPTPDAAAAARGASIASRPEQSLHLGGLDRSLPGRMDDVRIYGRALDAVEVRELARGSSVERGLVGHWPFDAVVSGYTPNGFAAGSHGGVGAGVVAGEPGPGVLPGTSLRFSPSPASWVETLRGLEARVSEIRSSARLHDKDATDRVPSVDSLLERLRERRVVLVHVAECAGTLVAFRLDPRAERPVRSCALGPVGEIHALARALREIVGDGSVASADRERRWREASPAFARAVWDPVERLGLSGTEVWLRLGEDLAAIPFAALVDGRGVYLGERYAFARVGPVAGLTRARHRRAGDALRVVAVANPAYSGVPGVHVPESTGPSGLAGGVLRGPGTSSCLTIPARLHGTTIELDAVVARVREHTGREPETLSWQNAYEHRLASAVRGAGVVHIASHGYRLTRECLPAAPAEPLLLSGIELAGVGRARPDEDRRLDDGYLSAAEIARLPLAQADLVVFSGCDTAGVVERERGLGMPDLPAAAWLAGAGGTLGALWAVDDGAISVPIDAFYDAWLGGASPAVALQRALGAARRACVEDHGHSDPACWAALVLEGL